MEKRIAAIQKLPKEKPVRHESQGHHEHNPTLEQRSFTENKQQQNHIKKTNLSLMSVQKMIGGRKNRYRPSWKKTNETGDIATTDGINI